MRTPPGGGLDHTFGATFGRGFFLRTGGFGSRFDLFVDFEGPSDLDLKSQAFFFLEADFCF